MTTASILANSIGLGARNARSAVVNAGRPIWAAQDRNFVAEHHDLQFFVLGDRNLKTTSCGTRRTATKQTERRTDASKPLTAAILGGHTSLDATQFLESRPIRINAPYRPTRGPRRRLC